MFKKYKRDSKLYLVFQTIFSIVMFFVVVTLTGFYGGVFLEVMVPIFLGNIFLRIYLQIRFKNSDCRVGEFRGDHEFTEWSKPKNMLITESGAFRATEHHTNLCQMRYCVKCKLEQFKVPEEK